MATDEDDFTILFICRPTSLKVLSSYFLNILSTFSLKACYLLLPYDRVVVRVRTRCRSPSAALLFANGK